MMDWVAWWILRNRNYSTSSDEKPVKVKSLIVMIIITAVIFTAIFLLSQPMCPKSEQKIIHVPAVKGQTSMDSYEAYDYIVCVKQTNNK